MWSKKSLRAVIICGGGGCGKGGEYLVCALNCWHLFVPAPTPRAMLGSAKSRELVTEQSVV